MVDIDEERAEDDVVDDGAVRAVSGMDDGVGNRIDNDNADFVVAPPPPPAVMVAADKCGEENAIGDANFDGVAAVVAVGVVRRMTGFKAGGEDFTPPVTVRISNGTATAAVEEGVPNDTTGAVGVVTTTDGER